MEAIALFVLLIPFYAIYCMIMFIFKALLIALVAMIITMIVLFVISRKEVKKREA